MEALKSQGERMLAIEHELEAQRELMSARFEAVDKRFEDIQRYMDKRFGALQWMWAGGVVLIAALMSIYQFVS